jgi:hypothetical protein
MSSGSRVIATVLYEDSSGVGGVSFGPHLLVMACLFDIVNGLRHELARAVDARPMNGDSRVINALTADFEGIARDGRRVLALLDADRIRKRLDLNGEATEDQVRATILANCPDKSRARVYFLGRNLEALLRALPECGMIGTSAELLARAVSKKHLNERDICLGAVARDAQRHVRDCLMQRFVGLRELVHELSRLAQDRVPSARGSQQ